MKLKRRKNPEYYRTIIRIIRPKGTKIRVSILGYRKRPLDVGNSAFKRFRLKAGDRFIGEVTLGAKPKDFKIKNVKRLPKPSKAVLAMFPRRVR